jgi:hypothetical protein
MTVYIGTETEGVLTTDLSMAEAAAAISGSATAPAIAGHQQVLAIDVGNGTTVALEVSSITGYSTTPPDAKLTAGDELGAVDEVAAAEPAEGGPRRTRKRAADVKTEKQERAR